MMAYNIDNRLAYLPSVKEVQEVNEQLRIIGHHPMAGFPGSVLGYTFEKILSYNIDPRIALSMAYGLGEIAGIRQERTRRKEVKRK